MLGEQIYEAQAKRTGRRVLSVDGGGFRVEVSFEASGKLLGFESFEIGTYGSESRPDGTLYGEGQGVVPTPDAGMATWKAGGVGKFVGGGAVNYRGAVYFSTASPQFARLNAVAAVFEYDLDVEGNTRIKLWEWK